MALMAFPILIFFLFFPLSGFSATNEQDENCKSCHSGQKADSLGLKDIYAEIDSYRYAHPPMGQGCSKCHISTGLKQGRAWEVISPYVQKDTILFLQGLVFDRNYSVDVTARNESGNKANSYHTKFTPSEISAAVENDRKPPAILSSSVEDLKQAAFLEASIRWETDEPSNAIIEYGPSTAYGEKTRSERAFVRDHRLKISGLAAGNTYHYRITARDMFGNSMTSGDFAADMSGLLKKASSYRAIQDRFSASVRPEIQEAEVFKVKGTRDYYMQILADQPVRVTLKVVETSEMDKHGSGLLPARTSMIDVCLKCHAQGASHPVGVRSTGMMQIPAELPTIEGGMMTCVTCHEPHGGNKEYFGRMDMKKELCAACHK